MNRTFTGAVVLATMLGGMQSLALAQDPLQVSQPVQATQFDLSPARTYGAPSFAVDPEDPLHVFASAVDLRTQRCGMMESTDGGQTWVKLDASPSLDSYPMCLMTNSHTTQGKIAFGSGGTLYYGLAGWDSTDGFNRSIFLGRSDDDGASWKTTTVRDTRGLEGEDQQPNRPLSGMAIDTSGDQDTIYLTWRQQNRFTDPNRIANQPIMAVSTDGGATFSEPINLTSGVFEDEAVRAEALETVPSPTPAASAAASASPSAATPSATASTAPTTSPAAPRPEPSPSLVASPTAPAAAASASPAPPPPGSPKSDPDQAVNFGGSNPVLAIDDKGTAYSAWVSSYQNQVSAPNPGYFLTRTSDQGKTLEILPITGFAENNVNSFGGIEMVWSPEGGGDGTLHVLYEGSRAPDVDSESDVFHRMSTDRGQTWSEPKTVNDDDPEQLYFSGIPKISIAPNGRLDAAWFDTRSDPGTTSNDVYYASSSDNGATWSKNVRISEQSIDRKIGVFASRFDLNAPPGIASTDSFALVGWDDTRNFDTVTEGQDIYVAAVQYDEIDPATSNLLKYGLAAVVGLAVVGVLFVLLALLARRREAGPTEVRRPAPAG